MLKTDSATNIELSIIIVNWNVCELLRACLISLQQQMLLARDRYEVIVIDNASGDQSVSMLRQEFPDVILHASDENLGFARGCNKGFEIARGAFVLLLNPDTLVVDHAVDILLDDIRTHPQTGVIGSRQANELGEFRRDAGGAFPTLANVAWNYLFLNRLLPSRFAPQPHFLVGDPQGRQNVDWVSGAAMLVRRNAAGDHLFNESFFMYGEDMDICDRIKNDGWEIAYTGAATITHFLGKSFEQQSEVSVLQAIHKGPRAFFQKKNGRFAAFLFDLIMLLGFLSRWILFGVANLVRPGKGFGKMSAFSRRYVLITLRHLSNWS